MTVTGNVDDVLRTAAALGLTELPVTGGDGPVALSHASQELFSSLLYLPIWRLARRRSRWRTLLR